MPGSALFTDRYELTMVAAARAAGQADVPCTFEVFARSLPPGRRLGVLAGTGRLLELLAEFRLDEGQAAGLREWLDPGTVDWLAGYHFGGDIDGLAEGEPYSPNTPVLSVRGGFAECVVLETLVLSVLNHDTAVASAATRMVAAAGGRECLEMGSRRTHEQSAVAAARAAYLVGFAGTSNLQAGARYAIPTVGTSAHAFTLLFPDEATAFAAQVAAQGVGTTLLVDTYDVREGVAHAVAAAGPGLGAVRLDSGDLAALAVETREQLDALGATATRIVVTSDLDEFAIAALASAPVDAYGVGTSVVTGSGAPTAGFVFKLVERDGTPVAKRSAAKATRGGAKSVARVYGADGRAVADVVRPAGTGPRPGERDLSVPLVRAGVTVGLDPATDPAAALAAARATAARARAELPREALLASRGEPALAVRYEV